MGCGSSSDTGNAANETSENAAQIEMVTKFGRGDESILDAYHRLDEEICSLEGMCPGPRLASTELWISLLESQLSGLQNDIIQLPLHMIDNEENDIEMKYDKNDELEKDIYSVTKVRQLAEKLNIALDIDQATKYEEFIASISRRYMADIVKTLKEEILRHARKRANELLEKYTKLRALYMELDNLIVSVTEGAYTNESEQKLDEELESARQIRDKLGGACEQWRISANLLHASTKEALLAVEHWRLVGASRNASERLTLAMECRSSIQGSLVAFQCGQESLAQVEIPHITQRQISAVNHANEYLLTDMANKDRYQHTVRVLEAYEKSVSLALKWLYETFRKTLKKDLAEAEDVVLSIAKQLREFRTQYIRTRASNKFYLPDPSSIS